MRNNIPIGGTIDNEHKGNTAASSKKQVNQPTINNCLQY